MFQDYSGLVYYAIISATLFVCLAFLLYRNRTYQLPQSVVLNVFLISQITGLVGARLFHVFYEEWAFYTQHPELILEFWRGGYVYYAGVIIGTFCALLYLRLIGEPILKYLNLYILPVSLGTALGRWACVFAGCCYGRFCELPWALGGKHPTAIYSSIWELGILGILFGLEKKGSTRVLIPVWLFFHGLGRFMIEQFRGDDRGPIYLLSISSWVSVGFILVALIWIFLPWDKGHKKLN